MELRLFVPKIEGSTDECAPGELGTDYQTPGYGYQVFDDNGNLLAPDSNSTPVTCNAIDELNNAASYLYTIPTHSQSLVIRYLAEDAENLSCMPYAASFTVGDSVPTVIINGDRTQTYYTGETFRLTTTFEDDEDTPMLTRWEIIGSEHPTMYGNDFHSYLPSAGTYDVMVTAWDQWGNAAYDQITVEIVPPSTLTQAAPVPALAYLGLTSKQTPRKGWLRYF